MAALLMVMSAGYLGAVAYIPVSLAALIFYTFPFYVAVLASLTGREPMTRTKAAALVVAFAGLILALGPSFDELNWRGIACGVAGSLAMGTAVTFGGPVMRQKRCARRERLHQRLGGARAQRLPGDDGRRRVARRPASAWSRDHRRHALLSQVAFSAWRLR